MRTLAGDLRVGQVRLDLKGEYNIVSTEGRGNILVAAGDSDYSIQTLEGSVGSVLRDGGRLALDISLNSNWSFFGEYTLRLRVARWMHEIV